MTDKEILKQVLEDNRDVLNILQRGHEHLKDLLAKTQGTNEDYRRLRKRDDVYKSARYRVELLIIEAENYLETE